MKPSKNSVQLPTPEVLPATVAVVALTSITRDLRPREPKVHDIVVGQEAVQDRALRLYSAAYIRQVIEGAPGSYRARILRVELLVFAMLLFVLGRAPSLMRLLDRLTKGLCPGLPVVDVSASAFYKRLTAVSHEVFLALLRDTTRSLASSPYRRKWVADLVPFATRIFAIDDTTLDALARKTERLKRFAKGATATLGGRLGGALDLVTGCYAEIVYDPDSAANEKCHFWPLVTRLGAGALYVFDLGYFSFPLFDRLTESFCYFVTRLREKTSFIVVQTLADGHAYRDRIIFLGKHRADRAAHPVRLVELLIGTTWYRYVTNVLDPNMLPADRLWALYGQRWTIEVSFAAVKRALNMAFLRLCHQNGMLTQIWCTLIVYQVLQHLRLEIAAKNGWHEDEVSWMNLMIRIGWYLERPDATRSLREWILDESPRLLLKKRGVRKRRATSLPRAILDEIALSKPAHPNAAAAKTRTARQSNRAPRPTTAAATASAPVIEGRLS